MKVAAEGTRVTIGAQNMHFEESGAFTGEISAAMLEDLGIMNVLIGHSERRQYFGETDDSVNKKIHQAAAHEIHVTLCVGENLDERENGSAKAVVERQIKGAFADVPEETLRNVTIAYEPIWAIGTGKTASSSDANDMIAAIREILKVLYSEEVSEEMRILYGGSVKPDNVEELMNETDIDGGLVGGASLKPEVFMQLVNF
jgi:triosephosphate isomerase